MNAKLTITANLLAATLLTGCGGGGGGGGGSSSPAPATFNVNFVRLANSATTANSTCQIFAETADRKTIGYSAPPADTSGQAFSVVIHNADGSVVTTITDISSSSYRFRQSSVPNGGFVSFVMRSETGSYRATTFAKDLLPVNLQLGVRSSAVSTNCIGSTAVAENTYNAYIEDTSAQVDYYGFNHYNQDLSNLDSYYNVGGFIAGGLEFSSINNKRVLIAQYSNGGNNGTRGELGALQAFTLVSLSQVSEDANVPNTLNNGGGTAPTPLTWTAPQDADLTLSSANMFIHEGTTGALLWQPLSATNATSPFSYASSIGDNNYYVTMEGQYKGWALEGSEQLSAPMYDVSSPLATTLPSALGNVTSFTPDVISCSLADSGSCFTVADTGQTDYSDTIVRVYHRINNTNAQYTLYAHYNTDLPVMSFDGDNESLQDYLSSGNITDSELSLFTADADESFDSFIYGHNGADDIARIATATSSFGDAITPLSSTQQHTEYRDKLKYQPHTWLSASF